MIEDAVGIGLCSDWPVSMLRPLIAWPSESKAGRSRYGPYWPKPDTEMRMMSGLIFRRSS